MMNFDCNFPSPDSTDIQPSTGNCEYISLMVHIGRAVNLVYYFVERCNREVLLYVVTAIRKTAISKLPYRQGDNDVQCCRRHVVGI